MSITAIRAKNRRMLILLLTVPGNQRSSSHALVDALAEMGEVASMTEIKNDLRHLERVGAVVLDAETPEGIIAFGITEEGLDVCRGAAMLEGVRSPRPDERLR